MSNVIKFPSRTPKSKQTEHEERVERIRESLDKINRLMNELRNYNNQDEETI